MRFLVCLTSALLAATAGAQTNRLTSAGLNGDVLRLNVTDSVQAVRHFELPNPPRVVLDLFGIDRSVAEMPAPAPGSPAIEVRTGRHPSFLRVVVDLNQALPGYQVRQSGGLIEVGLGPTALPSSGGGVLIESSPVPDDPSRPPRDPAPVVAVGVEATPAAEVAPAADPVVAVDAAPAATPRAADGSPNLDDLTTDELLALIEAELEAAGLDQAQSAEELIEQVEAELDANEGRPAASSPPPDRAEWRLRRTPRPQPTPPADGEERLPFRFVDEEPAKPPPDDDDNDDN
ncbi:MAG: AMIN domain-containing protein [Acidobacteria bacterium]|nr:AMIN domain-containing protein [Acidobacteriota bacterium]